MRLVRITKRPGFASMAEADPYKVIEPLPYSIVGTRFFFAHKGVMFPTLERDAHDGAGAASSSLT